MYTSNAAITMCIVFIVLLVDNLANQFFISIVQKFSYLYYVYAYCIYNTKLLETWMIQFGLLISLITGIIFYILAYHKIQKMTF